MKYGERYETDILMDETSGGRRIIERERTTAAVKERKGRREGWREGGTVPDVGSVSSGDCFVLESSQNRHHLRA